MMLTRRRSKLIAIPTLMSKGKGRMLNILSGHTPWLYNLRTVMSIQRIRTDIYVGLSKVTLH